MNTVREGKSFDPFEIPLEIVNKSLNNRSSKRETLLHVDLQATLDITITSLTSLHIEQFFQDSR